VSYTADRDSGCLNIKYRYMTGVGYNPSSARVLIQPDLLATSKGQRLSILDLYVQFPSVSRLYDAHVHKCSLRGCISAATTACF